MDYSKDKGFQFISVNSLQQKSNQIDYLVSNLNLSFKWTKRKSKCNSSLGLSRSSQSSLKRAKNMLESSSQQNMESHLTALIQPWLSGRIRKLKFFISRQKSSQQLGSPSGTAGICSTATCSSAKPIQTFVALVYLISGRPTIQRHSLTDSRTTSTTT